MLCPFTYNRFEAGTPAIAEAIGLGASCSLFIKHWYAEDS